MAEATGVFFYVFPGIAAISQFTVNASPNSPLPVPFFSNILQVGFAFAFGIAFAIITCAPVSGGHFNPASKSTASGCNRINVKINTLCL
jgi:glycerol uptake facilitator-like aquaporin